MLLFSKIGIPPFLGAVSASITGYSVSIIIALICLKKECKLKYRDMFNTLLKNLVPLIGMILVVVLLKWLIPINYYSRLSCILYVAIISIAGAIVYGIISYKMHLFEKILGKSTSQRLLKKLTLGKLK